MRSRLILILPVALLTLAVPSFAHADSLSYAAVGAVNIYHVLPPYPQPGTAAGAADAISVFSWQAKPGTVEWQEAADDAAVVESATLLNFMTAGIMDGYAADNAPAALKLLDRLRASIDKPVQAAKDAFNRPRPFRTLKLPVTCDAHYAPQAGPEVGLHDSYPSGHAARGWATALVLVMIAPDHAGDWLARGQEFGESRVACGVHYPSDIAAGRLLAAAVVDAVKTDEEFKIDLTAAQAEYERLRQLH